MKAPNYPDHVVDLIHQLDEYGSSGFLSDEALHAFAHMASNVLYMNILCGQTRAGLRPAALDAIHALNWLCQPPERTEVIVKRADYKRRPNEEGEG